MTHAEFAALVANGFQPGLVEPVAENLRRIIVERMAAALEFVQYGVDGAGVGEEVLPTFAVDHNSELGMWFPVSPVLMVFPAGGPSNKTGGLFNQTHEIVVRVDLIRDVGASVDPAAVRRLVSDVHIYTRALVWIILNLDALDLIEGMTRKDEEDNDIPTADAPSVNITNVDYDSLRRREGKTAFRWATQLTVEIGIEER